MNTTYFSDFGFFFSLSDGIVYENLIKCFNNNIQIPEVFQIIIENIYSEIYLLHIDTNIKDSEQKKFLFEAIEMIIVNNLLYSLAYERKLNGPFPINLIVIYIITVTITTEKSPTEALPLDFIGMNVIANHLLFSLNIPKKYHIKNPFNFINLISLWGKMNFFKKYISNYQHPGVI
ncbi:hypothetical protein BC936DRAFT_149732 [Jimgerdemannia flammicorona]|uniref:Uncharacterized protein n=1 Tax=Jimgerdemannia flammicorona TaxID=994334 RepID=A0A433D070_9FUNG|nr:hypothetical protein BC936DRAFT_149732 [Jimgerdemannia flammicorona]